MARKERERQERAGDDAAEHAEQQGRRRVGEREAAGRGRGHGGAIDQQGAGIVEQALPFEDGHDAMRQAELTKHGRGRRGIRRCDDGAKRDGGRPRHPSHMHARQRPRLPSSAPTATSTRQVTGSQLSLRSRGEVS